MPYFFAILRRRADGGAAQPTYRRLTGQSPNEGRSAVRMYLQMNRPTCLPPDRNNQRANGPIGGHLLNRPLNLPMSELATEPVNEGPRSTLIHRETIHY